MAEAGGGGTISWQSIPTAAAAGGLADTRRVAAVTGLAGTVAPPVIDAVLGCDSCIFPHEGRGKKATVWTKVNKFLPQTTCG